MLTRRRALQLLLASPALRFVPAAAAAPMTYTNLASRSRTLLALDVGAGGSGLAIFKLDGADLVLTACGKIEFDEPTGIFQAC